MQPEPGVSAALARERAARISNLRVALHLSLPSERTASISGTAIITFHLADTDTPVVVDFAPNERGRLQGCEANGVAVEAVHALEHVIVPAHTLAHGPNTLRFTFLAGDAALNRRDDHLYTIFVPARARETFPCFDQPNLKARWTLTLDLPDHWVAVSNASVTSIAASAPGRTSVAFEETPPLPTYLVAFAAGAFLESVDQRDGRELRVYHAASDSVLFEANRNAILDSHAGALRWLERYTALAYPFGKFDIVLLPAFQFGGMEHPGAIFYNSAGLLLTPSATRQQELARAHVIAHETAHMWFGDLVTMTWFDDVWMKEVFANFMAAKIVNPLFPDIDHDLRFLHAHYPAAYDVDRTAGSHAIRQPLANLRDAGTLYGAIIYLKSPIVMRHLELMLGAEALRDALRVYLARFSFGNADWPDLVDVLTPLSETDIRQWSTAWIDEPGRPTVRVVPTADGDILSRLEIHSSNGGSQQLQISVGRGARVEHVAHWTGGDAEVSALSGTSLPDFILPNGQGLGYGEFDLDERSRSWLLRSLPAIPDALTRASAWLALWDEMLGGDIDAETLLDLAIRAVALEPSELNRQRVLSDIERLLWIFIEPGARVSFGPRLESVLRTALAAVPSTSARGSVFATLRTIASSPDTIAWLSDLWTGTATIEGLALDEPDMIALALDLAVRLESDNTIVKQQIERTRHPERRAALEFVAAAVSPRRGDRDRFFDSLADANNRVREPWVIQGMRWLNHPLRAESAIGYLAPGLNLLEEVRRTGDIFLPKRWLDALLSGHRSVAAAAHVRAFLDSRGTHYPDALTRMILASGDHLFRAARQSV